VLVEVEGWGARLSDYASLKAQGEYMGLNKCSNIYSTPHEKVPGLARDEYMVNQLFYLNRDN